MSLLGGSLFTETITIEHPPVETGEYDDWGDPITTPAHQETVKGWYEPRSSSEDVAAKDQQVDGYWVYLPRGVPLEPQARVLVEGDWYEVDGEPGRMPDAFLLGGYLTVAVRRVRG